MVNTSARATKTKLTDCDVRAKINQLLPNGHSIRSCAAKLGISPTTVLNYKKATEREYQARLNTIYPIPKKVLHVVLWSGGKDSSALLIWALEHLPRKDLRVVFCDTGWESPLTYQFIETVNQRLLNGQLITLRSKKYASLPEMVKVKKRFPSVKARFCTEELKIIPTIEWILQQSQDIAIYQGIRAEESLNRSKMKQSDDYFKPQLEYQREPFIYDGGERKRKRSPLFYRKIIAWLENYDCSVERPLFYWKEREIIELCKKHQVLNPLYELGFKRVGCFPCVMESKAGIANLSKQFPKRIAEIAELEGQFDSTFFGYGKVPDSQCKYPQIADVVQWATAAEQTEEVSVTTSCMSQFQQCE